MKATVIMVGMLIVTATASPAQMVIGLTGGATYSDFSNPDTKSRWGYTAGLFAGRQTYRTLTQLEVAYTQKGGEGARIDYIEGGITTGGLAGQPSGMRGRPYAGLMVAFPVSCDAPSLGLNLFCDNTNTEWGIPVGLMIGKWKENGGFVGVDFKYTLAMSDASLQVFNNSWAFRVVIGRPSGR